MPIQQKNGSYIAKPINGINVDLSIIKQGGIFDSKPQILILQGNTK